MPKQCTICTWKVYNKDGFKTRIPLEVVLWPQSHSGLQCPSSQSPNPLEGSLTECCNDDSDWRLPEDQGAVP